MVYSQLKKSNFNNMEKEIKYLISRIDGLESMINRYSKLSSQSSGYNDILKVLTEENEILNNILNKLGEIEAI